MFCFDEAHIWCHLCHVGQITYPKCVFNDKVHGEIGRTKLAGNARDLNRFGF